MGRVGDQLASQIGSAPPSLDSMRAEFDAQLRVATQAGAADTLVNGAKRPTVARSAAEALPSSNAPLASNTSPSTAAGDVMTKRAQARGDSMAKAAAARFSGGTNANGTARGDTLRGVVSLVGSGPTKQVVLRANGVIVTLSGMATNGLAQLAGTEITVRGLKTSPRDVVVLSYVVRAVGGVPAWDGVLQGSDGQWVLRLTEGGIKRFTSMPDVLRSRPGARVWISARNGSSKPEAYGVVPAR